VDNNTQSAHLLKFTTDFWIMVEKMLMLYNLQENDQEFIPWDENMNLRINHCRYLLQAPVLQQVIKNYSIME